MLSVRVLSAKKTARDAADRRVVRDGADSASSSSASDGSGKREKVERSGTVRGRKDLSYGEVRGDESRRSGCRERDVAASFARRARSSSDSGNLRIAHGRVI